MPESAATLPIAPDDLTTLGRWLGCPPSVSCSGPPGAEILAAVLAQPSSQAVVDKDFES